VIIPAQIDDSEVHEAASGLGTMPFGLAHEHRADTCFSAVRINRQQAQVRAFAPAFQVDAAGERDLVFGDEELSFAIND
jgi:hypothetical protein